MKKIIVISDTHKDTDAIKRIKPLLNECDYVIHLGDYITDTTFLKEEYAEKLINVKGNCDVMSREADEIVLNIEDVNIFITHGHKYRVKTTLQNLGMEALANSCTVALFGHTHLAGIWDFAGVKLINPGSLSQPRSGLPSYCYITLWKGKAVAKIVEI